MWARLGFDLSRPSRLLAISRLKTIRPAGSALTGCHAAVEPTNPRLPATGTERASGAMWLLSTGGEEVGVQAASRS